MSMNCDSKNSKVLNILDVRTRVDIKHDSVIISNYYSSASDDRKKLKISWKSLTN